MEMNNSQAVVATKEQERNTLKKIKKMVEALGPDSYLATAFKGCFEDAEGNIEDAVDGDGINGVVARLCAVRG